MTVDSVNIGEKRTVNWKGKPVETGIFKYPTTEINLGLEDVENDAVVDRKYHGGIDKACYIYSKDHYEFWQKRYPNSDWENGMFGENITVNGLDESQLQIGDILQIGEAKVQISQPRQPCMKLNVRFNNTKILKDFLNQPYPGIYVRILKEGMVKAGDKFEIIEKAKDSLLVTEVYSLLIKKDEVKREIALGLDTLSEAYKESL